MDVLLIGGAALFHLIAAILSLRMVRITGLYVSWILVALAISLAALRRCITFYRALGGDISDTGLFDDAIAFTISILMLAGVAWLAPLFQSIKNSEESLRAANIKLEDEKSGREKLILEIQDALAKIRTLKGMLPICASCKRIRDDAGYWNQIEAYVRDHSEAEFSHGICPDCAKKMYPKYFVEEKSEPEKNS